MPAPIESKHRELMNELAALIDAYFNGNVRPKKIAFCLLIANFGDIEGGRVNYISNANRDDMLSLAKEWIARVEGAVSAPGGTA